MELADISRGSKGRLGSPSLTWVLADPKMCSKCRIPHRSSVVPSHTIELSKEWGPGVWESFIKPKTLPFIDSSP
jgi:hypothetical protein